ncbi:MAG: cache domain-containing protein [Anaerolineales bacterium]|jgi:two-component system NtrC family sensor kinase
MSTGLKLSSEKDVNAPDPAIRSGLRISIGSRIVLNSLLVITIISAFFIVVGIYLINNRIGTEAQERVNDGLNSAWEIYQSKLNHVSDVVQLTAGRPSVAQAVLTGDKQIATAELLPVEAVEHLDAFILTDASGKVVLRTNNPGVYGDDLTHNDLIAAVMSQEVPLAATGILSAEDIQKETTLLVERADIQYVDPTLAEGTTGTELSSGMFLEAAAPIFNSQGDLIGILLGASILNKNYEIVDDVKQTVFQGEKYNGQDIGVATIFLNDVRISTNVMNTDGTRAIGTRVSTDVYNRVILKGESYIGRAYGVNNWYLTAYEPIRNIDNQIVGILGVGILEQKYTDIKNQTILAFLIIALLGALASMLLSYVISRRITSHVQTLVSASREVTKGNLDIKIKAISKDEFGELATTFNSMASALKERDERLKEFTRNKIMESERLALIGQLSANVAHELNNPLQGIVTYSHLLLEETPAENPSIDLLQKIVIQANRCRDIIRGLLDFSRQRKPDKTLCDVNNVLKGCVALLENQAIFHNIQLIYNLDGELPKAIIDPSQIERVFMNIIINAAEAMNGSGQLKIATRSDPDRQYIEVELADTGPGIAKENLEKIFDPFFTTKDTGHGVGLGLAISYGIIKEHAGTITVESEVGRGTTFIIRLPVSVNEEDK